MTASDLNAERKRRAGLADTGRCSCGRYRMFCNGPLGCLDVEEDRVRLRQLASAHAQVLYVVGRRGPDFGDPRFEPQPWRDPRPR